MGQQTLSLWGDPRNEREHLYAPRAPPGTARARRTPAAMEPLCWGPPSWLTATSPWHWQRKALGQPWWGTKVQAVQMPSGPPGEEPLGHQGTPEEGLSESRDIRDTVPVLPPPLLSLSRRRACCSSSMKSATRFS